VQSYQGVEEEESWFQSVDGVDELRSVGFKIEPERWGIDDVQVEGFDIEMSMPANSKDTFTDHECGVFSEVDESRSFALDLKVSKAWSPGCDAEGDVEAEPGLAAFRSTADNAYSFLPPEIFDEPVLGRFLRMYLGDF